MLHTVMGGYMQDECIISDDGTRMMDHLTHPKTRPIYKKHIGGYFSNQIPVPKSITDPTHRVKYFTGTFFDLVKSVNLIKKLDTLRLKKH